MSKFVLRRKTFGIREGHPDRVGSAGREFWEKFKGLGGHVMAPATGFVGAVAGASNGTGALSGALTFGGIVLAADLLASGLLMMGADSRRSRASRSNMSQILYTLFNNYQPKTDYVGYTGRSGVSYNSAVVSGDANLHRIIKEDEDPAKFGVTFAFEDGKGVIYLNKPGDSTIHLMDELLDTMIKKNRRASYAAKQVKGGSYLVLVDCASIDSYATLIYETAKAIGKVNCLTDKKLKY